MQETEGHVQSFVKKSQALASALQQQGRTAGAVARLGSSIGLLASLGIAGESMSPLVQSLVMTRTKLHDDHATGNHAGAATKPSGKTGSRYCRGHRAMSTHAQQCHTAACCCSMTHVV